MPGISRCPPALTPVAIRACTLTVRPPSHQDHRGGLPARTAPCPDHRSRSHGQAVPELLGPCARYTEAAHQIWSPNVISRPIATERVTSDRHTWVRRRTAGRRPNLPNSGRCVPVYLCAGLYIPNGGGDRQFSLVVRTGSAPNRLRAQDERQSWWRRYTQIVQFGVASGRSPRQAD
jgi:hypothetical protein